MNSITNSPIKEAIRQKHHAQAEAKEVQINSKLNADCTAIQIDANNRMQNIIYKKYPPRALCAAFAILFGVIFAVLVGKFFAFLIGAAIGVGIYVFIIVLVKKANANLDAYKRSIQIEADIKVQQLRSNAASQIRAIYTDADRKTQQEIDRYDDEVNRNCQIILKSPDLSETMVDYSVNMFQRIISHADSASNRKFVEASFTYSVDKYGISYRYQSTYSNPLDEFNFDKQRYRNLSTQEECEGLARAIAKMTISKMKKLYPPNSMHITVSHIDAMVTLHFKAANKKYVPPRDIF